MGTPLRIRLSPVLLLALAALIALAATASGRSADPGVTSTSVLVGGTVPLSGEAASGGLTAKGAAAYFKYAGKVNGRKVNYKYLDDAYDPAKTVQETRQLVEQDHVFAIFNPLGTAQNIATRPYLNQVGVPQLFVASGWGGWARQYKQYPLTMGFIPTYTGEGIIYAHHILKTLPKAKIGVLYQDDDYGRELLAGLRKGLGSKASKIVKTQGYDSSQSDVQSEIASLKASKANTLMIFAFGKFAIQGFVYVKKLGWKPQIYVNAVAAATSVMSLANTSGQTQGAISIAFFKDPASPRWANDKGMALYRKIMKKYVSGDSSTIKNGYYLAGMVSASSMVSALKQAGKKLTRKSLMNAMTHLNIKNNPFVLPGIVIKTTPTDRRPIEQVQLQRWKGSQWKAFGGLLVVPRG